MTRQELKDLMPDITDEQISAVLAKHHEEINAKTKAAEDKFSAYKDKADKRKVILTPRKPLSWRGDIRSRISRTNLKADTLIYSFA